MAAISYLGFSKPEPQRESERNIAIKTSRSSGSLKRNKRSRLGPLNRVIPDWLTAQYGASRLENFGILLPRKFLPAKRANHRLMIVRSVSFNVTNKSFIALGNRNGNAKRRGDIQLFAIERESV